MRRRRKTPQLRPGTGGATVLLAGALLYSAGSPLPAQEGFEVLVAQGSVWTFSTGETSLDTDWREPGFDDGDWQAGPSELGYGDGDEETVVPFSPGFNRHFTTTYFRQWFNEPFPRRIDRLHLRLKVDDGAAIYLNGVEVQRINLPEDGPVYFNRAALSNVFGEEEERFHTFTLEPDALVEGENLIAVEVHQWTTVGGDVDMSFDLELSAELAGDAAVDEVVAGGIRYRLFTRPPRVEREAVAPGGGALETIPLVSPAGALKIEGDGLFVGSGSRVVRFDLDGGGAAVQPELDLSFFGPVPVLSEATVDLALPLGGNGGMTVAVESRGGGAPADSGAGGGWTASATAFWLELAAAGDLGGSFEVGLDTDGLAPGRYATSVIVRTELGSALLPVRLVVYEFEPTKLVADPVRPVVYAIHPGTRATAAGALLFFDAETGAFLHAMPIGREPTDLVYHRGDDRLYIGFTGQDITRVVDPELRQELPPLHLGDNIHRLCPAGEGHLITTPRRLVGDGMRVFDTRSGEQVGESIALGSAECMESPAANLLFVSEFTGNRRALIQFDVSSGAPVEVSRREGAGGAPAFASDDGGLLFSHSSVFDRDLNQISFLGAAVRAITASGSLAFTEDEVWRSATGRLEAELPFRSEVKVVSGDQRNLLYFDWRIRGLSAVPINSLADPVGPGPEDGRLLDAAPSRLTFTPREGAGGYRVYFGEDAEAVAAATPASPLLLGQVEEAQVDLGRELLRGGLFYWRVDILVEGAAEAGPVWSFGVGPEAEADLFPDPTNSGSSAGFGATAAMEGGLAVFGVRGEKSAEVFVRRFDGGWSREAILLPDTPQSTSFGGGVALSSGTALVSHGGEQAEVLVYERPAVGGEWELTDRLRADFPSEDLRFASGKTSFAVRDDVAAVGASVGGGFNGAVFIYRRNYGTGRWEPEAVAVDDVENSRRAGDVVALSDRFLAFAGRTQQESHVVLYAYDPAAGTWSHSARIRPERGVRLLAMDGETLMVSSGPKVLFFRHDAAADHWEPVGEFDLGIFGVGVESLSVDGDWAAAGQSSPDRWPGVALYQRRGGIWWEAAGPERVSGLDGFGDSVALSGDRLLVGDPSTVVDGRTFVGSATLYRLEPEAFPRPRFISRPPTAVDEGRPYRYAIQFAGGVPGTLQVQAEVLPAWADLSLKPGARWVLGGTPSPDDAGRHRVRLRVEDGDGKTATQQFWLEVVSTDDPPVITGPDAGSREVFAGQRIRLQAVATGSPPLRFQWRRDGEVLPGEDGALLLVEDADPSHSGDYSVAVSNGVGAATSRPVRVRVRAGTLIGGPWQTEGVDAGRGGYYPVSLRGVTLEEFWRTGLESGLHPAVAAGDRVFVSRSRRNGMGQLYALEAGTGEVFWRHEFGQVDLDPPAVSGGRVFVRTGNPTDSREKGQLWALDAATGEVLWNATAGPRWAESRAPAVAGGLVWWVASGQESLFRAVEAHSGQALFSRPLSPGRSQMLGSASWIGGRAFTWSGGVLREHGTAIGETLWEVDLHSRVGFASSADSLIAVAGEQAFLVQSGRLAAFDLSRRGLDWALPGPYFDGVQLADGLVYASRRDFVDVVDAEDGELVRSIRSSPPLMVTNDTIVSFSRTNRTILTDIVSGEFRQALPEGFGSVIFYDGLLLVVKDSEVVAYGASAGGGEEPPRLSAAGGLAATEDRPFTLALEATGAGGVALSAPLLPAWLRLEGGPDGSFRLTGVPGDDDVGTAAVEVEGRDAFFNRTTLRLEILVRGVNDPPRVLGEGRIDLDPGSAEASIDAASLFSDDGDGGTAGSLSYRLLSASGGPPLMSAGFAHGGSTLRLRFTPGSSSDGAGETTRLRVRATDPGGLWADSEVIVHHPPWTGPVLMSPLEGVQVRDGQPVELTVGATGADLTYQWRRDGVDLPGETGARLELGPVQPADAAAYSVVVSNAGGRVESAPAHLQVDAGLPAGVVNRLPVAGALAPVEVLEDGGEVEVDLAGVFTDPDGAESLSFSVAPAENGELFSRVAIDGGSGLLRMELAPDAHGVARLTIRATDALGGWTEVELTVVVRPVNDAPETTRLPDLAADPAGGRALVDLRAAFSDAEDGAVGLVFRILSNAGDPVLSAASINPVTGVLALRFREGAAGSADLRVRATDRGGQSVEAMFRVTVPAASERGLAVASLASYPSDRDADRDGFSDLAEVLFGAGTTEPGSRPWSRLERHSGGGFSLRWSASPDYRYRVEVSDDLAVRWRAGGVGVQRDGGTAGWESLGVGRPARFFRVVVDED